MSAVVIVVNSNKEVLFLLNQDQAELGGGEPNDQDRGLPSETALRHLEDQTALFLAESDLQKTIEFNGKTYYVTPQLSGLIVMPKETYTGFIWSKIYHKNGKWYVNGDVVIKEGEELDHIGDHLKDYIEEL